MALGAQITRVHRAISFKQARIFKSYIDYNTEKRSQSSNSFNKNLYKLKNNSLYGKTCENVRKRINLKVCNNPDKFVKFTSKMAFKKTVEITDDVVLALLSKSKIYLDKPIYIGQAVLDLSKYIMYDLYYNKLKSYEHKFSCQINIMGGDTDSLFLECCNVSLRKQLLPAMLADKLLDTSNYKKEDPLYDNSICCKIGCIKDEAAGAVFGEFVLLQPKMYSRSYLGQTDEQSLRRAKGVQRNIVKRGSNTRTISECMRTFLMCMQTTKMSWRVLHLLSGSEDLSLLDTKFTQLSLRRWLFAVVIINVSG